MADVDASVVLKVICCLLEIADWFQEAFQVFFGSKTFGEVGTACGNGVAMGSVLLSNDETLVIIELNLRGWEARVPSFYRIFEG